jgi:hypothetical protein
LLVEEGSVEGALTLGFVALWRNNRCEYHATHQEEFRTTQSIHDAFALGDHRGIRRYGLYCCRWGSSWQYFTFWLSPGIEAVVATIRDLERAGDFKFADSRHIVGRLVHPGDESSFRTTREGDMSALFLAWRRRGQAPSPLTVDEGRQISALLEACHCQLIGKFNSGFGSEWEGFMVCTAPSIHRMETGLVTLEDAGLLVSTDTTAVTGILASRYRFGNHLQEGPAT